MRPRSRGFTLLEMLVAVAIFALVSVMTYVGLSQALRVRDRLQATRRFWSHTAIAFAEIGRDLGAARDRPVRDGSGAVLPAFMGDMGSADDGSGDVMEWTRGGGFPPDQGPGSTLQRIAYRVSHQRLERLVWPVLDRAPTTRPEVSTLLRGVRSWHVRYYGANGQWSPVWPVPGASPEALPAGIRLVVRLSHHGRFTRWWVVGP